ncbi:uncharacterized protein LOC124806009 isoform X1 [Hydra vulgaris]|uniref:uncharacterized protein LOC124806009 isoform X1 n=2 Tax=Hydra vulgaris TaxID=6087 RepID=UPI001F5E5ED2|nr:uncharacterized protein LOC124806009 isoform X1 [Hydra vulgaris]
MDPKITSILSEKMSFEWKTFARGTGTKAAIIDFFDLDKGSDQTKMEMFLTDLVKRNENSYFALIEKSLKELGKDEILNETKYLYEIYKLKLHYIMTYGNFYAQSDINSFKKNTVNLSTDHFDLVKVETTYLQNVKDDFNEWTDHIEKQNIYKKIAFEEVFSQDLPFLLISGIAGIGKTYFLKKCLLLWAHGLLWKNVDFVFYFDLKKLNNLNAISSLNELIRKFYGNILKGFEISSQRSITLVIDGLDNFTQLDNLIYQKLDDIPLINTLNHAFNSKEIKCVLAGRVRTAIAYWSACKGNDAITNIQIMGLNNQGITFYFEDILLSSTLKNQLNNISSLSIEGKLILSVPLYLKAICKTVLNMGIFSVNTITELLGLVFYYFIQKKYKNKTSSLHELMHIEAPFICAICNVAFNLLENGNSFVWQFTANDSLKEDFYFIKKCNINQQYEFHHYMMLKFCASVHLYMFESLQKAHSNKRLHACLPIITGLTYGRERNMLSLISSIKKTRKNDDSLLLTQILELQHRKLFVECFYESQVLLNDISKLPLDVINKWFQQGEVNSKEIIAENYFSKNYTNLIEQIKSNKVKIRIEKIKEKVQKTMNDAISLYEKTHLDKAVELFREAEQIYKIFFGKKHHETICATYWIAVCLHGKNQFDKAEQIFKNVEIIRTSVLGEKHESTLNTKFWIARCLYSKKQYDEAKKLFMEVENVQQAVLGNRSKDTLKSKYWIAICSFQKKKFEDAIKLFSNLEAFQKEILGEKHLDTINTKYWIASCLYSIKKFKDAYTLFTEVEKVQSEVLGKMHPDTVNTIYWITSCQHYVKKR